MIDLNVKRLIVCVFELKKYIYRERKISCTVRTEQLPIFNRTLQDSQKSSYKLFHM